MKRDYFYHINDRGEVFHDGTQVTDPAFLSTLISQIVRNETAEHPAYAWFFSCGNERNFVAAVDSPVVFASLRDDVLVSQGGTLTAFHPHGLRYSAGGVLYHEANTGDFGRISTSVLSGMVDRIETWGSWLAYRKENGSLCPILPVEESNLQLLQPRTDNPCVACGGGNPHSMEVHFVYDRIRESVSTYIVPDERMCGSLGVVHGGFVSLFLDECMGKALSVVGVRAPTARLTVQFRLPMQLGVEYLIESRLCSTTGRKNYVMATIEEYGSHPKRLIAEGNGLFISPRSNDT